MLKLILFPSPDQTHVTNNIEEIGEKENDDEESDEEESDEEESDARKYLRRRAMWWWKWKEWWWGFRWLGVVLNTKRWIKIISLSYWSYFKTIVKLLFENNLEFPDVTIIFLKIHEILLE